MWLIEVTKLSAHLTEMAWYVRLDSKLSGKPYVLTFRVKRGIYRMNCARLRRLLINHRNQSCSFRYRISPAYELN